VENEDVLLANYLFLFYFKIQLQYAVNVNVIVCANTVPADSLSTVSKQLMEKFGM